MSVTNIRRVLLLLALSIGAFSILLGRHYTATRPAQPDTTTGAINYYKGVEGIAYLTDSELWLVHGSFWLTFAIVLGNVLLAFVYPEKRD